MQNRKSGIIGRARAENKGRKTTDWDGGKQVYGSGK
jgi:hypothetical protein